MGLTTVLWIIVALVTKPDPDKLLDDFYTRVRPLGFWKPYSLRHAPLPKTKISPILRGIGIAFIGFCAITFLILGLTGLWFGQYRVSIAELIASIFLFIVFSKTANAYLAYLTTRLESK
jgi:hypothetical protein